jgi:hypothetical protein
LRENENIVVAFGRDPPAGKPLNLLTKKENSGERGIRTPYTKTPITPMPLMLKIMDFDTGDIENS